MAELLVSSLITTLPDEREIRFSMLDTVREHAREQLTPEERAAVERRHSEYYLGLAHDSLGREDRARAEWEAAHHFHEFQGAALLKLAQADARGGRFAQAIDRLRAALRDDPDAVRAAALEVALLRHAGRTAEAGALLREWRPRDRTSSWYSAMRRGTLRIGWNLSWATTSASELREYRTVA